MVTALNKIAPACPPNPAKCRPPFFDPQAAVMDISEDDWLAFNSLTRVELSPAEKALAARPDRSAPEAREFMAIHWHPEWAPLELIEERLALAFPEADESLAIPTQHNRILSFGPWAGVEADVYDRNYGLKVQLLIHFRAELLPRAGTLKTMMDRTYNYRVHQLMDIIKALAEPDSVKLKSSLKSSVGDESIMMARFFALRLERLIKESGIIGSERDEMLKNRLMTDFMLARVCGFHQPLVDQALTYINAVKKEVKNNLSPDEFYSPQELIEEARGLQAGIIIPHPPLFWPILLSDLDIDGWEIWNPSTPDHTLFLLAALNRANESRQRGRELLPFMGDDTHMSAKFRRNGSNTPGAAQREIGFQDPWNDARVKAKLSNSRQSLSKTLSEYRQRLG